MIEPQLIYIQIQDKCLKLNKKYPEYYSYISRQSNSVFKICVCLNNFVTIVKDYINGNNYNFDYEFEINFETISIKEVCDIFLKIDRLIRKDLLKKTMNKNDLMKKMGIALPLLFLVIMFSDTYLLGHFTTMLFVFFSSIIYKDYDDETI